MPDTLERRWVLTGLAVPAVVLVAVVIVSWTSPACFPWADGRHVEPLTCTGPKHRVQTISEMTARKALTAELLSGTAAVSLIGIYAALEYIRKQRQSDNFKWKIMDASFAMGALGFVGLTVWSLRVNNMVHTCFTSQTIMAVFIQVTVLMRMYNPSWYDPLVFTWVFMTAAMLWYVGFIIGVAAPEPTDADEFFDQKYYKHAWGQFAFFAAYYALMIMFAWQAEDKHGTVQKVAVAKPLNLKRPRYARVPFQL